MLGQQHGADRYARRHSADARIDHAVANGRHQPSGDGLDAVGVAIVQHHAEFVRGEPADAIPAAQRAAQAAADDGDHLVADVEAVGLVDQSEVVDAGKQERALGRSAAGVRQQQRQLLGQAGAVELAGELVMAAEIEQPLLLLAPVVDHPKRALRMLGARLLVDEADAAVLDPQRRPAATPLGEEAVVQAISDLGPGLDMRPAGDAVIAAAGMLGIDQKRERPALAELERLGDAEHLGRILRPVDAVAGEVPAIRRLAHAFQDVFEVELLLGPWRGAAIFAALAEIDHAGSALHAHRRHVAELG